MSFDAAWLDLREPADRAARDPALLAAAARYLAAAPAPVALDLGCGTGATVRAFAGQVSSARWRLLDNDPALLRLAAARCGPRVETLAADLADADALPLAGIRLVTASALLDLCGEAWIRDLAHRLSATRTALYAALSYDGHLSFDPPHRDDPAVSAAFNAHQRRDKGLGPALGPDAVLALARALESEGYEVRLAESPWLLGPQDAALHTALTDGIARAAQEAGLQTAGWAQARRAASGSAGCRVGHVDVLALPQAASAQSKTTSLPSP